MLFLVKLFLILTIAHLHAYNVGRYLCNVGDTVVKEISEPVSDDLENILDNIDHYNELFRDIIKNLRLEHPKVEEAVKIIWKHRKPKFVDMIDLQHFQDNMRMTDMSISFILSEFQKTEELWKTFEEECLKRIEFCLPEDSRERYRNRKNNKN